jgi:hypothetical protein
MKPDDLGLGRRLKELFGPRFGPRLVTIYDQFGRPVYVPSPAAKIGDTIIVKRPVRFRFPESA